MSEQDAAESGNATNEDASTGEEQAADGAGAESADTEATEGVPLESVVTLDFDGEISDELIEHVAESDPETVARELAALGERVADLEDELSDREDELANREEEVEDLTSQLKRKQADFENYKKRMKKRREEEKQRATEDLVERLLDVRDNLGRALEQEDPSVEDLRNGVETTVREFDRVLDEENVEVVEPEPGEEVDPERHEVLMRVESDQPEDAIADVHRPGYVMAGKVLRTAQVTVSDSDE